MSKDESIVNKSYSEFKLDDVREYLQSRGLEPCGIDEVYEQNPAWQLAQTAVEERPSCPSDFEKKYFTRDK